MFHHQTFAVSSVLDVLWQDEATNWEAKICYFRCLIRDPVDMGTPSLILHEFGDCRVDLGTPLSIDVNGCIYCD